MSNAPWSIGIDPGKVTGFAVYNVASGALVELRSMNFWSAFWRVRDFSPHLLSRVVVEVPESKHVWQDKAKGERALLRQGINVGSVIRESELLAEGLSVLGYPVVTVHPRRKVNHATFQKVTGWTERTNQHQRDAGLLCFGK